jgi:UDP-GlcNAc:undecaprenyl-phosphate GlcNAc-1-phosphate transferase
MTLATRLGELPLSLLLAGAGVLAALLVAALTPLAGVVARRVGAVDHPGDRRVHATPTPRMGGLALLAGFLLVAGACWWIAPVLFEGSPRQFAVIVLGAVVIAGVGAWDDARGARPLAKLAMQCAVGALVFFGGLRLEFISWPFVEAGRIELGLLGLPITVFWFAGLMNAMNVIDGLDGLCSGISAISSFVLAAIIMTFDATFFAVLPAITVGLCIGFLVHNYHPARIFLGDTGSLLLGYLLACSTLTTGTKSTAVLALLVPILCIAVPVVDMAFAIVRRTSRGRHPFSADKEHIHHRLLGLGLSQRRVVWILWFLTAYLGMTGFTLEKVGSPFLILANAAFLFFGFLLLVENVSFLAVAREKERTELESLRVERTESGGVEIRPAENLETRQAT